MKNQKGQIKIILGVGVFVIILSVFLYFQFFRNDSKEEPITEEEPIEEEDSKNIFEFLFGGGSSSQNESTDSDTEESRSVLEFLFGGGGGSQNESTGSGTEESRGIFEFLFGGGSSSQNESTGSGTEESRGIFEFLFGGGSSSQNESTGVDTEEAESSELAPPKRSNASPSGEVPYYTKKINISLNTDKVSICRYDSVKGLSYESMKFFSNTNSTAHSTEVTGLSEGQEYKYYVKCRDQKGNTNKEDFLISFEVAEPKDTTPPTRVNPYPAGDVFPADTKSTLISIATNEPAYCRYSAEQGKDYSSLNGSFSRNSDKIYHTATVSGLESGKDYSYFVRCIDESGNKNTGDVMIYFSIQ